MYGLFFAIEMVDEREDETADRANEHQPIEKLHARHLLPSRKKADTSNCLPRKNITYVQNYFKKIFPVISGGNFLLRTKLFARIIAQFH